MRLRRGLLGVICVLGGSAGQQVASAKEKLPVLTVTAFRHAYHNALVTATLPKNKVPSRRLAKNEEWELEGQGKKERLPCQATTEGNETRLTFLLPNLAQGEKCTYRLRRVRIKQTLLPEGVQLVPKGTDLDIFLGKSLFTTYTTHSGPNKPFFYPILAPNGGHFTRRWPMEQNTNETQDHPHHRGLWFTHGNVNGFDFWSEEKGFAKTVPQKFEEVFSGEVCGGFRATTEWRDPKDTLIATDVRTVRIFPLSSTDRVLDFEIVIKPVGGKLTFGDTKEGMFGMRLPDALAPSRKQGGHIENAQGKKDKEVWGKASEWVDNWGTLQGETYGVAIFDHPRNLRHPQTWHARDYGLFAVNPFGLHDFGLGGKGAGDFTLPENETLTLRYRVLFHKGDTATATIAEHYMAYADPPEIEVR